MKSVSSYYCNVSTNLRIENRMNFSWIRIGVLDFYNEFYVIFMDNLNNFSNKNHLMKFKKIKKTLIEAIIVRSKT